MPVSPYFKHVDSVIEQDLNHSLAIESIFLSGIDVYYIKSTAVTSGEFDDLFGENRFETLDNATLIEMYLENMETPYGGGDFYSKFGLQHNQTCNFLVAYRRFEDEFGGRPKEGDFIYIPTFESGRTPGDVFRIAFVDVDQNQYETLGSPLFYQIKTERATFSHHNVQTGIDELDASAAAFDVEIPNDDSETIEGLGDLFADFSETHPFGRP